MNVSNPIFKRHGIQRRLNSLNLRNSKRTTLLLILVCLNCLSAVFAGPQDDVLKPYEGPSVRGADPNTLTGKVMTGYQGWFNCPGDGANLGWTHWAKDISKPFAPGNIAVDLWPDVSEYDDDELYTTVFSYPDGTQAKTFSSHNRKTVLRHFKWMRDYGIDGAFVQRFANGLHDKTMRYHKDTVLSSAREGANRYGRTYTIMYDLTGIPDEDIIKVFDDWRMLRDKMHITEDPAFQHHNRKPLVAIWGVGFNNKIKPRPGFKECTELIKNFKADGCSLMLGVPTGWRAQDNDALQNPELHSVLLMADVLSPWCVGRFGDLPGVERHTEKYWQQDIVWAREHKIGYMPVVFPGFSWHNLTGAKIASIPRLDGQFLWSQVVANKKAGANMLYIAMFDEVDEATAIFKCSNNPPASGGSKFLTLDGLPSDFYLRLAGQAGKLLRDEIPLDTTVPAGVYKGKIIDGIGKWIPDHADIPVPEYKAYAGRFNPVKYNPDAWVQLAKEAGTKYIVITTKHHDGFALYDSKATDWDVVDATPYDKDLLKPLAQTCKKHDIKLGFYYSQTQDWCHQGGVRQCKIKAIDWEPQEDLPFDNDLNTIAVSQVREILSNYNPISVLWWDTPAKMADQRGKLFSFVSEFQPQIIENNRRQSSNTCGVTVHCNNPQKLGI